MSMRFFEDNIERAREYMNKYMSFRFLFILIYLVYPLYDYT